MLKKKTCKRVTKAVRKKKGGWHGQQKEKCCHSNCTGR